MTRHGRKSMLVVVTLLAAWTTSAASRQQSASLTISLGDALTYYEAGERDAVIRALYAARGSDAFALVPFFEQQAERWIRADGPGQIDRRRILVATFALEAAHAGLDHQWEASRAVVEWACEMWRRSGEPSEAEHEWMLAALALLEGSFEPGSAARGVANQPVRAHLGHIRQRFPKEPRVHLAEALLKEYEFWTGHYRVAGTRRAWIIVHNDEVAATVLPSLIEAARPEPNRPEALLRIGFLEYRLGRLDAALEHLSEAMRTDEDPTRTYLAHLFTGWVHEKAGRPAEAVDAFKRAFAVIPGLSAALAIGVRLYDIDQRDEADAYVEAALRTGAATPDPWKTYGYGDLRRWPYLIAALRERAGVQ
jgi:tetratricopeptide (TPR) repeat protein